MTGDPKSTVRLALELSAHQPQLLEGLEQWLRLGLISDAQVRTLGQAHLICALSSDRGATPAPVIETNLEPAIDAVPTAAVPLATAEGDGQDAGASEPAITAKARPSQFSAESKTLTTHTA